MSPQDHVKQVNSMHKDVLSVVTSKRKCIQIALLNWAENNGRDFTWRHTNTTPYQIMIAEVLLKRTTAQAVANVYDDFIQQFPKLENIAQTSKSKLAKILKPLGLQNQRTNSIKALASYLLQEESGEIPDILERLLMVPGLGDYSARAILAFAFDKKFAVLDSNVQRILIRIFKNSLPNNPSEKLLQELAQHLLPDLNSKDFNLALIDFGSQICSWRYVKCDECPVTSICDYYQTILKQENFE